MNHYLIAVDLDGTLLTTQKKISNRTKLTLQSMIQLGNDVVIATGRPKRTSLSYFKELELKTPLINLNGAIVHDPYEETREQHLPISQQTANEVLAICYDLGIENVLAEVRHDFYMHKQGKMNMALDVDGLSAVAIGDLRQLIQTDVTSFTIHPRLTHAQRLFDELQNNFSHLLTVRDWGDPQRTIEILNKKASKASGVEFVARHLGYEKEQIIAFGDELNDLDMLLYAGTSVAMGNAREVVKNMADFVTESCDQDGIAIFLEQHVLDGKSVISKG